MSEAAQRWERGVESEILKLSHIYRFNPLDFPICTRTPERHNVDSAWMGHVPFAMCLMDMVKPRVLVELGTDWGVSYCAFCQAVKELRLPTECFAVDTWMGDPHARFYSSEVLDNLKEHHDQRYALFSKLLQSTFDGALAHFADSSIDVLHIDGYHTYEAVKHDFETWLPKMSDRGVVLIHDIEVRDRETFGVWRFWDEIKQKYPHFAFYHSFGLGVLSVGESSPDGLRPLLFLNQTDGDCIRRYFENLGRHLAELHVTSLHTENLERFVHAKTDEVGRLTAELDESRRTVAGRDAELDESRRTIADLSTKLHESHRTIDDQSAELNFLRHRHSQLWFQASNKAILMLRRAPFLFRTTRAVALGSDRLIRRIKRLVSSPVP